MANKARDIGARKLAVCSKIPIGRSLMLVTKDPSVFLRLMLLVVLISDIMVHNPREFFLRGEGQDGQICPS